METNLRTKVRKQIKRRTTHGIVIKRRKKKTERLGHPHSKALAGVRWRVLKVCAWGARPAAVCATFLPLACPRRRTRRRPLRHSSRVRLGSQQTHITINFSQAIQDSQPDPMISKTLEKHIKTVAPEPPPSLKHAFGNPLRFPMKAPSREMSRHRSTTALIS